MSGVRRAREAQRAVFPEEHVSLLAHPSRHALDEGFVDVPGAMLPDAVVEQVVEYGSLAKIATMAALRQISGVRAEIAMLSLGRGYFQNCVERSGKWTSGVHLLQWTLVRLIEEPMLGAADVQPPITLPLERLRELAQWQVVAFRLVFIADVAQKAAREGDPVGRLAALATDAVTHTQPGSPDSLLSWLRRQTSNVRSAFPPERYTRLREELRSDDAAE